MESVIGHISAAKQHVSSGQQALSTTTSGQSANSSTGVSNDPNEGNYQSPPSDPIINPDVLDYGDNYSDPAINPDFPEYGPTHNQVTTDLLNEKAALTDELRELGGALALSPSSDATPEERQRIRELLGEIYGINDDLRANILQQTAPILVLPEGQGNLPADPADFIAEAQLKKDNGIGGSFPTPFDPLGNRDDIIGDNTDGNPDNDFSPGDLTGLDSDYYLDVDHESIVNIGSEDAPIFYQADIHGDPPRVSYHMFYPYNDGPYVQNHEGDFETVTVHLNPDTLQPEYISYSAHGGVTSIPYEDAPKDPITGQPMIFVAGGSHANYAEPGSYDTNAPSSVTVPIPGGGDVTLTDENLMDHTPTDVNGDGIINSSDNAVIVDTSDQLAPATDQTWYPDEGNEGPKYGEQGDFIANDVAPTVGAPALGTDGPTGLSGDKGHLDLNLEGGH